jgi:hypothetical protein
LFRAAELSLDESTTSFRIRRTVAITLYAESRPGTDREKFDRYINGLTDEISAILNEEGFDVVGTWGPHSGSHHITLFGTGRIPELGGSFRERIKDICETIGNLKETWPRTDTVLSVVFFVGGIAVFLTSPAIALAHPGLEVPMRVFEAISLTYEGSEVPGAIRKLLRLRPPPPPAVAV